MRDILDNNLKLPKHEIIKLVVLCVTMPFIFLILSWDFKWIEGWIVAIWLLLQSLFMGAYLYLNDPQLVSERLNKNSDLNQKQWDKYFLVAFLVIYLLWMFVIALGRRFHWPVEFPLWIGAVGILFLILSTFFTFNAVAENTFASTKVRIQSDRNQRVISTGVYSMVRHPMYIGAMFSFIGIPFILDSLWGLFLGFVLSLMFAIRILGEEKMLEEELPGYKDYEKKVKFRLIPKVW